jgi:hypothetical protein
MRKPFLPWCLLIVIGWSGCGPLPPWHWAYKGMEHPPRTPILNKSVAIVPFVDNRPSENSNYTWLFIIPLMPYGWQEFNRPEEAREHATTGRWQFRPSEDLAQALAQEINTAHLFKRAIVTNQESEGDLVLTGTIFSTKYESKTLTYGLSSGGVFLWYVGVPVGKIMNELHLRLNLTDRNTGNVLWVGSYTSGREDMFRINRLFDRDAWYPEMLQQLMPSILQDMETALKESVR